MTTQLEQAAKMALEALECKDGWGSSVRDAKEKAITALRAALEQSASGIKQVINLYDKPEQPAHQDWCASLTQLLLSMPPKPAPCNCKPKQPAQDEQPRQPCDHTESIPMMVCKRCLSLTAVPAQDAPVAWADMDVRGEDKGLSWTPGHFHKTPLYTLPQAREPLTDEQIWKLAANCLDSVAGRLQFARAIEQAHGIGEKK